MKRGSEAIDLLNLFDSSLQVYTTSNVLSNFMLQIAWGLTKSISIYGCDGRKVEDNDYFWSHGKTVQIIDKMENIKRCHPAFFEIDFDDYYRKHIEQLRTVLWAMQKSGVDIHCATPTFIPPLRALRGSSYNPSIDVSVVIPAYNAAESIERTIQSCLSSHPLRVEIIVVDDGSSDDTARLVEELMEHEPAIKLVRQENSGVSAARNNGLLHARGRFCAVIDADDTYELNALHDLFSMAVEKGHFCVFGETQVRNAEGQALPIKIGKGVGQLDFESLTRGYNLHVSGVLLHRNVAREIEYCADTKNGEDLRYFVTLARMGYVYHGLKRPVSNYVWTGQSVTQAKPIRHQVGVFNSLATVFKEYENHPHFPKENQSANEEAVRAQRLRVLLNAVFVGQFSGGVISDQSVSELAMVLQAFDKTPLPVTLQHFDNWWNRMHAGRSMNDMLASYRLPEPNYIEKLNSTILESCPILGLAYTRLLDRWLEVRKIVSENDRIRVSEAPVQIGTGTSAEGEAWRFDLVLWVYISSGKLDSRLDGQMPSRTYPPMVFRSGPFQAMYDDGSWRVDGKCEGGTFSNRFAVAKGWNTFEITAVANGYSLVVNGKEVQRDGHLVVGIKQEVTIGGGYQERVLTGTYSLRTLKLETDSCTFGAGSKAGTDFMLSIDEH